MLDSPGRARRVAVLTSAAAARDEVRPRVLHVITHLDHGGAQDNTLLTIEGLDRRRFSVDLVSGPGVQVDRARQVADRLVLLPYFRRTLLNPMDLFVLIRLIRLCGEYDVVHTHGSKAGVLGRIAAACRGVPAVVHTVHGFPVTPRDPWWRRLVLLGIERFVARMTDRVVCVCDRNADEALELRIARPHQLSVVVSGIPLDDVRGVGDARAELGIPPGAPVVGTVTRLMEQKAPLDFVAAARVVLERCPQAHVLLIGEGPMSEAVHEAAADLPRLHLLGHRADVPRLLATMDVVAFSSLWEGLGRALTEAVVAGRPIVATAVNGVPDLVVDGVTGFLCPPGEPAVLADRITDLLSRPDRGRSMGEAGAHRIGDRFGVREMVDGLTDVYDECLLSPLQRARPA